MPDQEVVADETPAVVEIVPLGSTATHIATRLTEIVCTRCQSEVL